MNEKTLITNEEFQVIDKKLPELLLVIVMLEIGLN